jgi:hypothetical protein
VNGSLFRVKGSTFRVKGSTFRVNGSLFRVNGSLFRVKGSTFRMKGSLFRVKGSLFRVNRSLFRVKGSLFRVNGSLFRVKGSSTFLSNAPRFPKEHCAARTQVSLVCPGKSNRMKRLWSVVGILLIEENRSKRGKPCPNAIFSTTNLSWTGLVLNPGLCGERPTTERLTILSLTLTWIVGKVQSVPHSKHYISLL